MRIITSRRLIAYGKRFWICNQDWQGEPYPEGIRIVRPPQHSDISVTATLEYQEAFRIMSYLAKYDENDQIPENERKVFYSLCNR